MKQKTITPPLQVKWSVPNVSYIKMFPKIYNTEDLYNKRLHFETA